MVYLPDGLLFEDHLDQRWEAQFGECVQEIIFPSRTLQQAARHPLHSTPWRAPPSKNEVGPYGAMVAWLHHPHALGFMVEAPADNGAIRSSVKASTSRLK